MTYNPTTRTLRHDDGRKVRIIKPINDSVEQQLVVISFVGRDEEEAMYLATGRILRAARPVVSALENLTKVRF